MSLTCYFVAVCRMDEVVKRRSDEETQAVLRLLRPLLCGLGSVLRERVPGTLAAIVEKAFARCAGDRIAEAA